MTVTSTSIHADKPIMLKYDYHGKSAVLSIVDNDYIYHAHATIFMNGSYGDRLDKAVAAFNEIMHSPVAVEAAE